MGQFIFVDKWLTYSVMTPLYLSRISQILSLFDNTIRSCYRHANIILKTVRDTLLYVHNIHTKTVASELNCLSRHSNQMKIH